MMYVDLDPNTRKRTEQKVIIQLIENKYQANYNLSSMFISLTKSNLIISSIQYSHIHIKFCRLNFMLRGRCNILINSFMAINI